MKDVGHFNNMKLTLKCTLMQQLCELYNFKMYLYVDIFCPKIILFYNVKEIPFENSDPTYRCILNKNSIEFKIFISPKHKNMGE